MRLLFIVTSFWAYGELLIAVEFAQRARAAGHECLFMIPPSHAKIIHRYGFEHTLLIPNGDKINRILLQDIEYRTTPDLVVLADFLNYCFCDRHYGLTRQDLHVLSGKIGTFDNFDWALTHQNLDTYGFRAKGFDRLTLGDYDFVLSPCPLNYPRPTDDGQRFCYSLLDRPNWQDESTKRAARQALGIAPEQKLVLLTTATWQHTYRMYPHVKQFVDACNRMVERVLRQTSPAVQIISVGPAMLMQNEPPLNYRCFDQLHPAEFEKYIQAADLFISNNIGSTTLARVALSGVPVLVLFNSILKRQRELVVGSLPFDLTPFARSVLDALDDVYPFRMFPVGWYHFLNPLIQANPFCQALRQVELFDEAGCAQSINDLLYDHTSAERLRTTAQAYLCQLKALPEVGAILDQITSQTMMDRTWAQVPA